MTRARLRMREERANRQKMRKKSIPIFTTLAIAASSFVSTFGSTVHADELPPISLIPHQGQNKQQAFFATLGPIAQKLAQENNVYASVMLAQAAIESGFAGSTLAQAPNYNLFGIKGAGVTMKTQEDDGYGNRYGISSSFRKYASYEESLLDYIKVIKTTNFGSGFLYAAAWRTNTVDYTDATRALTGVYATATNYDETLNKMIQTYNLTQYDEFLDPTDAPAPEAATPTPASETPAPAAETSAPEAVVETPTAPTTYTVKHGDSLWSISKETGKGLLELIKANPQLKDPSKIFPGDELNLPN
ncbi:MAG: glucosaminidase domain-containing protein [Lactobacillales bacterium]|nr:glucosaminidase domain-containing protein [Lactobacillales bacterium]